MVQYVGMTATNSSARSLLAHYDAIAPWHVDLYKDLHQHPELSHQEHRTAGIVADRLRQLGYRVTDHIGGTGLVGVLRSDGTKNGTDGDVSGSGGDTSDESYAGPTVLARADMDGLPVTEATGLPYASTQQTTDDDGKTVGVMHACGHDVHITALLAAAQLLAEHRDQWRGTFIALFQPAEEVAGGARSMIVGGLVDKVPRPDVALGQHVVALPNDTVASRAGAAMSAADSIRVTVYGRGTHGSAPHGGIDPILLASSIVLRLQGIVSRELRPGVFGVVTVGSLHAGAKSNIIADSAELLINTRAYDEKIRRQLHASIERIVRAECQASGSPREPEFDYYDTFNLTENSPEVHATVSTAFSEYFGDRAIEMEPSTGSEDFAEIPDAFGAPYLYWNFGSVDPAVYAAAKRDETASTAIPSNHSPLYAPVPEPTLRTGTEAMVVALMAYLGRSV